MILQRERFDYLLNCICFCYWNAKFSLSNCEWRMCKCTMSGSIEIRFYWIFNLERHWTNKSNKKMYKKKKKTIENTWNKRKSWKMKKTKTILDIATKGNDKFEIFSKAQQYWNWNNVAHKRDWCFWVFLLFVFDFIIRQRCRNNFLLLLFASYNMYTSHTNTSTKNKTKQKKRAL
jgi:hypothetical protein